MFWTIIGTTVQLFQHWCKEKLCDRVNKTFCLVKFRSLITPSFFCITHTHRVVHTIYRWQWVHAMMENHLFSSFTNCFPNEHVILKIMPTNEAVILQIVCVAENKEREEWLWQPRQRTAMHWKWETRAWLLLIQFCISEINLFSCASHFHYLNLHGLTLWDTDCFFFFSCPVFNRIKWQHTDWPQPRRLLLDLNKSV